MPVENNTALSVILKSSDREVPKTSISGSFVVLSPLQLIIEIYRIGPLFREGKILLIIKDEMPIEVAYDVACALGSYIRRSPKNEITGFAEQLNLATALILSPCHIRLAPPFSGPIFLGYSMLKINISEAISDMGGDILLQRYGALKSGPEVFDRELFDNNSLTEEEEEHLAERIRSYSIKKINEWVPDFKAEKLWYSCCQELQEDGFLTKTAYYEDLWRWYRPKGVPWPLGQQIRKRLSQLPSRLSRKKQVWIINLENSITDWLYLPIEDEAIHFFTRKLQKLPQAIILIIRHNGGDFNTSDRLLHLLEMINVRIPIYVYVRRGLSSGYLLCCASRKITIAPLGRIGGVGTYSAQIDLSKAAEKFGVNFKSVPKEGCKTYGAFGLNLNREYKEAIKKRVTMSYNKYIEVLEVRRKLIPESLALVKEGQVFLGDEGVKVGLADSTHSLIDFMEDIDNELGGGLSDRMALLSIRPRRTYIHTLRSIAKLFRIG